MKQACFPNQPACQTSAERRHLRRRRSRIRRRRLLLLNVQCIPARQPRRGPRCENADQNPKAGHADRDLREQVAGLGAERALAAHAAAFAFLQQHKNDHDHRANRQRKFQ